MIQLNEALLSDLPKSLETSTLSSSSSSTTPTHANTSPQKKPIQSIPHHFDLDQNTVTPTKSNNPFTRLQNRSENESLQTPLLDNHANMGRGSGPTATTATLSSSSSSEERFVSFLFWLLGVGILLPWNAFTSAAPYFESRFCNSKSQTIRDSFEAIFGFTMTFSAVLSLMVVILYQLRNKKRQRHQESHLNENSNDKNKNYNLSDRSSGSEAETQSSKYSKLVILPLLSFILTFLFHLVCIFLSNIDPDTFFTLTILGLIVCGSAGSIVGAMFVSLASIFPTHVAMNPFFSGQALGAVLLISINFMLSVENKDVGVSDFYQEHCSQPYHDPNDNTDNSNNHSDNNDSESNNSNHAECPIYTPDMEAFFYFLLATVVLTACVMGYVLLERLPITQFYKESANYTHIHDDDMNTVIEDEENLNYPPRRQSSSPSSTTPTSSSSSTRRLSSPCVNIVFQEEMDMDDSFDYLMGSSSAQKLQQQQQQRLILSSSPPTTTSSQLSKVWKNLYIPALSIFFVMVVTLAIFPAWDAKLSSAHECSKPNRRYNDLFFPMTFVVYYVYDLIGRLVAGQINLQKYQRNNFQGFSKRLLWGSVIRMLFIPLFLLCPAKDSTTPTIFHYDMMTFFLLSKFAFTNGLIMTLCFACASEMVGPGMEEKEMSSMIMNLSMNLGLLMGSFLSFGVIWIGTGLW